MLSSCRAMLRRVPKRRRSHLSVQSHLLCCCTKFLLLHILLHKSVPKPPKTPHLHVVLCTPPYIVDLSCVVVLPTGFQDRSIQPLCHSSAFMMHDLYNRLLHIWYGCCMQRGHVYVSAVELDIKQIEQLQQLGFGDVALTFRDIRNDGGD